VISLKNKKKMRIKKGKCFRQTRERQSAGPLRKFRGQRGKKKKVSLDARVQLALLLDGKEIVIRNKNWEEGLEPFGNNPVAENLQGSKGRRLASAKCP